MRTMRTTLAVIALWLCGAGTARAGGLVSRLPEDGSWARFTATETFTFPGKAKKEAVEGTFTLASVGRVTVDGEECRWIELVIQAKVPGTDQETEQVFKGLIPEKHLQKGGDPAKHWIKGWMKLANQPPQQLTKEQLALPGMKLNLFVAGPLQDHKPLPKKTIETKLGKLECEGIAGTYVLKDASVSVKNGQVTKKDGLVLMESYFHEKAPFGVVWSHIQIIVEGGGLPPSGDSVLLLDAVGKDAKSKLPDNK